MQPVPIALPGVGGASFCNPAKLLNEVPLLVQEGARGWFSLAGRGDVALHAVESANL
jgi:hypothetical protein